MENITTLQLNSMCKKKITLFYMADDGWPHMGKQHKLDSVSYLK